MRAVELDDGYYVMVIRRPLARPPNAVPLPLEPEYEDQKSRITQKIRFDMADEIPAMSQKILIVTTKRKGAIFVQPGQLLYKK